MAAVSVDTRPGEITDNLRRIATWTQTAKESGADLVLFPELSLTGFIPNHPVGDHDTWLRRALAEAQDTAERLGGSAVSQLIEISRKHDILICTGMLEDAGNVLHNTQIIVGPNGLLGHWRKMHVPMFEMPFYNGGGIPSVINTPLGRIGVNICFDALIPESTRLLAVNNVEIVLFPFAADPPPVNPQGWHDWAGRALQARCVENGIFGLACNYVGQVESAGITQTFPGGGTAIDPRGKTIATWPSSSNEPAMMIATFDNETLVAARSEPEYLFRFRRPELYGPLTEPNG